MKYFYSHDFFNMKDNKKLLIIPKFKTLQQKNSYACGPACVLMMLNHLHKEHGQTLDGLVELFKTRHYPYGTDLVNIVEGVKSLGYKTFSTFDLKPNNKGLVFKSFASFKKFVKESIKNDEPILVLNVDYGGHYKVIIGYDEVDDDENHDMLIFADSLDVSDGKQDGYDVFPADRFYYMWFDKFEGRNEVKQGFMVINKSKK